MSGEVPDELVLNGVNASEKSPNRGGYLLTLTRGDVQEIAFQQTFPEKHLDRLRERNRQEAETVFELQYGRDDNKLAEAGWGVIFANDDSKAAETYAALEELLDWRKSEAGELYREFHGLEGYRAQDTADTFMSRHGASPGTVDPKILPYYLLIVGDVDRIPYRFQYELSVTYPVGRVYFDTPEEYMSYAHSVVQAEKNSLRLARRAVFFGTQHDNDRATQLSAEMLVKSLAGDLRENEYGWQVDWLEPPDCRKARLAELLGNRDAPALLFTASHGVGFDPEDPQQRAFQGALLCQDLQRIDRSLSRQHYLGAEDIQDNFRLHGLVAFHFACFGAGTPRVDSFRRKGQPAPEPIAPRDFLAALPRRLLSHPSGGALAVVGHVDRAWTYSFKWGEAGQQTQTFKDTLVRIMDGQRVGLALDQFHIRYSQVATRLTGLLDKADIQPPDPTDLVGLWTAHNDARGYALLGDPAVFVPVAPPEQPPSARQALEPIRIRGRTGEAAKTAATQVPQPVIAAARPLDRTPQTVADVELRRLLGTNMKSIAAQLDTLADTLAPPTVGSSFGADAEAYWPGQQAYDELTQKLRTTMTDLGKRLSEFVARIATLEVRTYLADEITDPKSTQDDPFSSARLCAMSRISLGGDTQVVIPVTAGRLDTVVWDVHAQAVEQAQANRAAMLKAIGELLAGLVPTGK